MNVDYRIATVVFWLDDGVERWSDGAMDVMGVMGGNISSCAVE
jgi:hypothetical protein